MRLLLTGAINWTDGQKDEIKKLGHEIIYIQDERISLKEQGIDLTMIEGVICNGLFLYNDIKDFKSLKYIQLTSAGLERVPIEYIKEKKIEIYNARGVYSKPMAEFAIAGVLQLYKQSRFFYEKQKKHQWKKNRNILELSGKTVCIIGCGSVGTECAKRFKAFECKVIGIDIIPREDCNYESMHELEDLENVLSISDIIILTLPLTEKTKYLMNMERMNKLKQGAILVNISRGAIVDIDALVCKLPIIGGALLDVYEEEPLAIDSVLWDLENVILTPHNSFISEKNRDRLQNVIITTLEKTR